MCRVTLEGLAQTWRTCKDCAADVQMCMCVPGVTPCHLMGLSHKGRTLICGQRVGLTRLANTPALQLIFQVTK